MEEEVTDDQEDIIYNGQFVPSPIVIDSSSEDSVTSDDEVDELLSPQASIVGDKPSGDEEPCCVIEELLEQRSASSEMKQSPLVQAALAHGNPGLSPSLKDFHTMISLFRRKSWLTACDNVKKIFCWPCLLFERKYLWSTSIANTNFPTIALAVSKHEITADHKQSVASLLKWKATENEMKGCSDIPNNLITTSAVDSSKKENHNISSLSIDELMGSQSLTICMTEELRSKFLKEGIPQPEMKTFLKFFDINEIPYDDKPWLAGSESKDLLFCWPCLLFASGRIWSQGLTGNLSRLQMAWQNHENSLDHMESLLKMRVQEVQLETERKSVEASSVDTRVDRNRRIVLANTVEAVCHLKKEIRNSEVSVEECVQLLELLGFCDYELKNSDDSYKPGQDHTVVSSFLNAILSVVELFILSEIIDEIKKAKFISLILEDTSPTVNHSLVSVIIRYVDQNGTVCERFVKFIKLKYDRQPSTVLQSIEGLISEFDCEMKLVGYTYDGGVISPENIPTFNKEMQSLFPLANFFPYERHDLRIILLQALSHVSQFRLFFYQLNDMANFFGSTPDAISSFLAITYESNADLVSSYQVWDFSSRFAITLWDYRGYVLAFFGKVIANPQDWSDETIIRGYSYISFLNDPKNLSYIFMTKNILTVVEQLATAVEEPFNPDSWKSAAQETVKKLVLLGSQAAKVMEGFTYDSDELGDAKETFSLMAMTAKEFIENRYGSLDSLAHFRMIENYRKMSGEEIGNLRRNNLEIYSPVIDLDKLQAQLEFRSKNSFFAEKTSLESLKSIRDLNMTQNFSELVKFINLVTAVPLMATESPAVLRVRSYVKENSNLNSTDALIWMEQNLLTRIEKEPDFIDRVVDYIT